MQQPNLEISVPNAVMLLQRMAAFGVHYAEIGFAGANRFVEDLTSGLAAVDTGAMQTGLVWQDTGPRSEGAGLARRAVHSEPQEARAGWPWWW